ncbi:MAG: hypothetical protein V1754_11375, partial [Pseudomonadota bacterium]
MRLFYFLAGFFGGICSFAGCCNNTSFAEAVGNLSSGSTGTPNNLAKTRLQNGKQKTNVAVYSSMPQLFDAHHRVFSLMDNRLLAHVVRKGGLAIPVGYPGVAKYMQFRRPWNPWQINTKEDDRKVALAIQSVTWLVFPLTAQQARSTTLSVRLKSPVPQNLRIHVNENQLQLIPLRVGWQRVVVKISPQMLRNGENKLNFKWGKSGPLESGTGFAAVDWVHVGNEALDETQKIDLLDKDGFSLPAEGGVAYYVYPYTGAKLWVQMEAQTPNIRCKLLIMATTKDSKTRQFVREETAQQEGLTETYVDLGSVANNVSRLELIATGPEC